MRLRDVAVYSSIPYGLIFLLSCTFLVSSEFISNERRNDNPIREYLGRRLRQTKVEIAKEYVRAADTESAAADTVATTSLWHYDIRWDKVWSRQLESERALTVGTLNDFFILEGNRVMSVVWSNDTDFSSSDARLRNVDQSCLKRSVKFAKSIVWKSTLYLLVCYEEVDACILYTGNNYMELENRQYIINKGEPVDATFFTRANRLYLVVAHNTDQFPVSSILYRWTGTYMDIIKLIETLGAVSVTAFNYKRSTIIIFGQNEKTARSDVGSEIYRFDDNIIEKIQYLSTNVPISITHYTHNGDVFLLITNEKEASSVYWWYGNEFLHWLDLPDIVAPSMVKVVYLNGETLFLVSYENMVCLYKITMGVEYSRLNLFEIKNRGEKVVDMSVWIKDDDDSSSPLSTRLLTLLLVTFDPVENLYRIDSWELRITKIDSNSSSSSSAVQEAVDATEQCLAKLEDRLEQGTIVLEDLVRRTWPILLENEADVISANKIGDRSIPSEDEITPMGVKELILHSGVSIGKVDILSTAESDEILLTNEMIDVSSLTSILDQSRKTLRVHGDNRLTGNVSIEGDSTFSEFVIDTIDIVTLNEKVLRTGEESSSPAIISASKSQIFSKSQITGRNITVRRLDIDSLCGIPYEHWLVRRENHYEGFDEIWAKTNPMESIVDNDTVVVSAANTLQTFENVELRSIDGIRLSDWLDNIFIVGKRQRIKGNIYQRTTGRRLNVHDLTIQDSVNGIPYKDLITRVTEQNISGPVFIDTMSIENILTTRINGIMVESGVAMISKENHITGQVSMTNLNILEELAIGNATKFREVRPVQVYDRVTIFGNIKARNLVSEVGINFNHSFEPSSSSSSNNKNGWNVNSIVNSHWTKSTNQTIKKRVVLANGLSIDELRVHLLNDIDTNEDILLTNVEEIDEKFGRLELTNFTVKGSIFDGHKNDSFRLYQNSEDALEINQVLRIEQLRVEQLYIESFNGIPLDDIMRRAGGGGGGQSLEGEWTARFNSTQKFETITVNGRIEMEHLDLRFVNGIENKPGRRIFRYDENYRMDHLEAEKLTLGEVELGLIRSDAAKDWRSTTSSDYISSLGIEGDALVEKEARIETIDRLDPSTYVNRRAAMNEWSIESEDAPIFDNLSVRHDLTLNFIRGSHLESISQSTLSKSRAQNLTYSRISFFGIAVSNSDLKVERINNRNVLDLVYLDSYDVNFGSDLVFDELTILGDIRTRYVNDYAVAGMYDALGKISSKFIEGLRVEGNVSWGNRGIEEPSSIDTIIGHAVRWKEDPLDDILSLPKERIIEESIVIEQPTPRVIIASVKLLDNVYGAPTNIRDIISDSVLDDLRYVSSRDGNEIRVGGEKSFVKDLAAGRLNVTTGEIVIEAGLNGWRSIDDLRSSIVRLESLETTDFILDEASSRRANTMLFRNGIEARNLTIRQLEEGLERVRANSINSSSSLGSSLLVHGLPISEIVIRGATTDDNIVHNFLPDGTFLSHLVVRNNAYVRSLDSIDFNEFANNRVVVNDDPSSSLPAILVDGNIRFNGRVRVAESASIGSINGIDPSDLVLNDSSKSQTIVGNETHLYGNMIVNGKTFTPLVGGISLKDEYENAVLNHEDVEIFGDIIFQSEYTETNGSWKLERRTTMRNTSEEERPVPSGFVNEIQLRSFIEARDETEEYALRTIAKNESLLEDRISRAWQASIQLPEIFIYLEFENDLRMSGASGIERVRVTRIEDTTILGMYANVAGSYCNLKDECPCRRQYVAEIMSNECRTWNLPTSRIFYGFHETNGRFAVSVTTNTVSSGQRCTLPSSSSNDEFTTISWINNPHPLVFNNDEFIGSNVTKDAIKIYNGYLSDARVFTQNDLVFIVLAMYYDPEGSSHRTNSLIYMLDIATNAIKLVKTISTDHAGSVHVFKIPDKGPHILFTSLASSTADSPAESVLYRLDSVTGEFRLLRSFASGGNRNAKSISRTKDEFLLLDDIATNSINVYRYDVQRDNFYFHQSIFHNSMAPIVSIEAFYTGEFRHSDVYAIVTTERDQFFVYRPELMGKFQLTARKRVNGILSMVPFDVADRRYMFVGTDTNSTILRIVEEGSSRT